MRQGIILLSHGSKSTRANGELSDLSSELDKELDGIVKGANLQFAKPNFWEVLDELIEEEIEEVIVVPLFVFAGRHVEDDLPELITKAKKEYPQIKIRLKGHLAAKNKYFKKLIKSIL